jgi:hypothetical protein
LHQTGQEQANGDQVAGGDCSSTDEHFGRVQGYWARSTVAQIAAANSIVSGLIF